MQKYSIAELSSLLPKHIRQVRVHADNGENMHSFTLKQKATMEMIWSHNHGMDLKTNRKDLSEIIRNAGGQPTLREK